MTWGVRRLGALGAVLLWVWTAWMWGTAPQVTAQPGIPAGAVRIMDGTHNQLARVTHTGQLAVDASVTLETLTHITSVTHVAGTMRVSDIAGNVVGVTANALNMSVTNAPNVAHIGAQVHVSGRMMLQNIAGTAVTVTGTALDVNCTGCAAASVVEVDHVSSVTHVAGTVNARIGFTVADVSCHEATAIHQTSSSQVIHGVGGFRIGLCSILLVSAHAQGLSLIAGQGTTCQTGQRPLIGAITTGTLRAESAIVTAANGGFATIANSPWLLTPQAVDNVCVMQSGSGSVSGVITWRPVP